MNTLSLREAAEEFDVPRQTLSNWVKAGVITPTQRGVRGQPLLLDRDQVEAAARHYRAGRGRWNHREITTAKSA